RAQVFAVRSTHRDRCGVGRWKCRGGGSRSRPGHPAGRGGTHFREVLSRSGPRGARHWARAAHLPRDPGGSSGKHSSAAARRRRGRVPYAAATKDREVKPLILLIEDDDQIRRFLRAALAAEGYRLQESVTANEGLAQAASRQPDLILLDLGLPDRDG